jgi:hypothetical protein
VETKIAFSSADFLICFAAVYIYTACIPYDPGVLQYYYRRHGKRKRDALPLQELEDRIKNFNKDEWFTDMSTKDEVGYIYICIYCSHVGGSGYSRTAAN